MQNGIDISIDTGTSGSLGITVQEITSGSATTLATAQVSLSGKAGGPPPIATPPVTSPPVVPTPPAGSTNPSQGIFPSDAWVAMFPKDSDGFTLFPIPTNAVIVGTQPGDAADLRTAQAKAHANGSNCILFRRGQTYTPGQVNDGFQLNGVSPALPAMITCVGDPGLPRPILQKGIAIGGSEYGNTHVQNVVIAGLDFYDPTADASNPAYKGDSQYEAGIRLVDGAGGSHHLWIEDCRCRFLSGGFELQDVSGGTLDTVIIRRCAVDHTLGEKWGIYTYMVKDLLIDGGIWDLNGWHDGNPGSKSGENHNAYLHDAAAGTGDLQTRVTNVITARASATGIEARWGGTIDNLFAFANPIAILLADAPGTVRNCVVDGGGGNPATFDLTVGTQAGSQRGWGILAQDGATMAVSDCIACNKPETVNSGFAFSVQQTLSAAAHFTGTNLIANDWAIYQNGTSNVQTFQTQGNPIVTLSNCDFPNQTLTTGIIATPKYVDATRCLASYAKTLRIAGATDEKSFLAAACSNRRGAYHPELTAQAVNDYIRAGFARA